MLFVWRKRYGQEAGTLPSDLHPGGGWRQIITHAQPHDTPENIRASHYSSCSLSTLPPKAKSCPQPPQKQNSNHNPQEIKASLSLHKQNKGFPQPQNISAPNRGHPLQQGFFQPHNMYFLSSKLRSRRGTRQQN